jgi:uncharacterized protein YbjQ (UPF0145 family)
MKIIVNLFWEGKLAKKSCEVCKAVEGGIFSSGNSAIVISYKEHFYCTECFDKMVKDGTKDFIISTTPTIEGYKIEKYIDVVCVEVVLGTGAFSEWNAAFADLTGGNATEFEKKLALGKEQSFEKLKFKAWDKGGNAIVGIDIDYTQFGNNMIGVIANGTVVSIRKEK